MNITEAIDIDGSPDRVWKFVIRSDLMAEWLMQPTGFEPIVGTQFTFITECDGDALEIQCEVLTVVPEEELTFSWLDSSIGLDSVVTIRLSFRDGSTRVELMQSGWDSHSGSRKARHATTWQECLIGLKEASECGRSMENVSVRSDQI